MSSVTKVGLQALVEVQRHCPLSANQMISAGKYSMCGQVLQVLEENVKLNGIHACVSRLDWHDFTSFGLERAFDLALAADCLYVSRVVPVRPLLC